MHIHKILDLRCQFTLDVFDSVAWDRSSGDRSHALSFHSCALRFHCSRKNKILVSQKRGLKKYLTAIIFYYYTLRAPLLLLLKSVQPYKFGIVSFFVLKNHYSLITFYIINSYKILSKAWPLKMVGVEHVLFINFQRPISNSQRKP